MTQKTKKFARIEITKAKKFLDCFLDSINSDLS